MDFGDIIVSVILPTAIAALVSVVGWFVIHRLNEKVRREEAQGDIYRRLFEMTVDLSKELMTFEMRINKNVRELSQMFARPHGKLDGRSELVQRWYDLVTEMLDDIMLRCSSIENYLIFLDMGGTNIGRETPIHQALKSVSIDTNKSLFNITDKWINYINFDDMKEKQLTNLTDGTKNDLKCIDEFCGCLNDVLVYLYNDYMAKPLKLKCRKIVFSSNRRYVTEKGLIDKRAQ